jgi:hypothetical protein
MSRRKYFFFEKKKQKTSVNFGAGAVAAPTPMAQSGRSFFAAFFSKKEALAS